MKLRSWQTKGVKDIRAAWPARVLYVAPQGAGKTFVATHAIYPEDRVLWLTPTRETAIQAFAALKAVGFTPAYLLADAPEADPPEANAWVGTVASARLYETVDVTVVVIDEAHHTPAPTWRDLIDRHPKVRRLGLTGSPWRLDGQPLGDHFDVLIEGPKPTELIRREHLADPDVYSWSPDITLPYRAGKAAYGAHTLRLAAANILVGDVFATWMKRAKGMQTIIFASTLDHSRDLRDMFIKEGVRAEHIDSHMGSGERDRTLGRFESGETQVLSTVGVLSEGWDMPNAQCMISARPMCSLTLWLQQCGRVTRPGMARVILDHAGNAMRLMHPCVDREWSLEGSADSSAGHAEQKVPCPHCQLLISPQCLTCPGCGYVFEERERRELQQLVGDLVPMRRLNERQTWDFYVERARHKGHYINEAEDAFMRAYGKKPPVEWYPTDPSGFGDYEILCMTAKRLGRPKSEAVEMFKWLRDREEYMPQPRVRLPTLKGALGAKVSVPKSVSLLDAPSYLRKRIKELLLKQLEAHKWNISKAVGALGVSPDVVETYCPDEYAAAKADGRVVVSLHRASIQAILEKTGEETIEAGARRHDISPSTLKRRLEKAGVLKKVIGDSRIYLVKPEVTDEVLRNDPIKRQHATRRKS